MKDDAIEKPIRDHIDYQFLRSREIELRGFTAPSSPPYINMTCGQFIGLVLAWAICPWKILYSAQAFTNFLGGYIICMAPAVGIIIADYYFISRGNIVLKYLYDGDKPNQHYYYTWGWSIQALIAYAVGVALPLPGFIGAHGMVSIFRSLDCGLSLSLLCLANAESKGIEEDESQV
jgi:cytosine/uracil/thiamine/allantoin permease